MPPAKRARSGPPPFVPADFVVPTAYTSGRLSLTKLCAALLDSDFIAVMGSAKSLTTVFAPADDWPDPTMTRSEDLVDLKRHEAEFNKRLAFAYTIIPTAQIGQQLPQTVGCIYINPATRKGHDAEVLLWGVSHGCSTAKAKALDADIEKLCRDWLQESWPFKNVAFPGRGETPWPTFEALPFRDEAVPRIAKDAETVFEYNARACGLARC